MVVTISKTVWKGELTVRVRLVGYGWTTRRADDARVEAVTFKGYAVRDLAGRFARSLLRSAGLVGAALVAVAEVAANLARGIERAPVVRETRRPVVVPMVTVTAAELDLDFAMMG